MLGGGGGGGGNTKKEKSGGGGGVWVWSHGPGGNSSSNEVVTEGGDIKREKVELIFLWRA